MSIQLSKNLAKLPETAYGVLRETGETIIIKRGETGYYNPGYGVQGDEIVDQLNERMGVTKAQRCAMEYGSAFGYHIPAADPDSYDVEGKPKRG